MFETLVQFPPQRLQGHARLKPVRPARPPAHLAVNLLFQINERLLHGHSLNQRPPCGNRQYRLQSLGGRTRRSPDPIEAGSALPLFAPRFLFVELFKHKERLMDASRVTEAEILQALYTLVSRIEFINEADIPLDKWMEAHRLCREVDEKDHQASRFIAEFSGKLQQLESSWASLNNPMTDADANALVPQDFPNEPRAGSAT